MTDRGSITPLVLGFVVVAMFVIAGGIAAGDAFVQQRGLQAVCDGAAAAGAADAGDLDRSASVDAGAALRFADVGDAVERYLARDSTRTDVQVSASVSNDGRTLSLVCTQTTSIAFGTVFGKGGGVHHVVHSSAQAPLT
ncbi:MAG TPA: pilus assembly protein TadG-related protein [Jatrophihabitantaceae bacterium]|nr:pilus assembly protein TadG-related protein [Jatrophihabitantaceae bacterium]